MAEHRFRDRFRDSTRSSSRRARGLTAFVTVLGWLAISLTIASFVAATIGHYQEFQVLGVGLAVAVAVAALFLIGRPSYQVEIDLRTMRVTVGEKATGRLAVTNAAGRRQPSSRMELPVGRAAALLRIPPLAAGEVHEELFMVPTQRRAVIPVGPARSVRGDALGLLRREIRWTETQLLYVHPRVVGLNGSAPGFLRDLEGQVTQDVTNSDVAFHALRNYVPGDDRRYIHWRTSARTGVLMVRQFEETRRSNLAVAVSTAAADYADDNEFELAVEAAASIGVQAFREERQISVLTSGQALQTPTMRRMLDQFSGVEVAKKDVGIVELSRRTAGAVPDASVAILLCGSIPTARQIRTACLAFALGVRVIAIRAVPGERLDVRPLGGAAVITMGMLEDLPMALRRVRAV